MKHSIICLISALLVSGCTTNAAMKDILNNQYEDKKIYADENAIYVGEWVNDEKTSSKPIKITKDGKILMCVSKKKHDNVNGKVYIENGVTMFIFEGGTRYKFVRADDKHMILNYYGEENTYYSGLIPEKCIEAFKNFE